MVINRHEYALVDDKINDIFPSIWKDTLILQGQYKEVNFKPAFEKNQKFLKMKPLITFLYIIYPKSMSGPNYQENILISF